MSQIVRAGAGLALGTIAVAGSATLIPLTPILILAGIVGGTVVAVSALTGSKGGNSKSKSIAKIQTSKGGDKFYVQSLAGDYCSVELNSDCRLTCNRKSVQEWEYFEMLRTDDGRFAFQASNKKYVSVDRNKGGLLIANRDQIENDELFTMEDRPDSFVAFKASNGKYVSRRQDDNALLKAMAPSVGDWELFRVMTKQDQVAMKDPITITETVVVKKTLEVKIDILNHEEIIMDRKGWFFGTAINFASWLGYKGAKNTIKAGVKKELNGNLKSSIEKGIDAELAYRLCEEVSQRIVKELGANNIKAIVIIEMK